MTILSWFNVGLLGVTRLMAHASRQPPEIAPLELYALKYVQSRSLAIVTGVYATVLAQHFRSVVMISLSSDHVGIIGKRFADTLNDLEPEQHVSLITIGHSSHDTEKILREADGVLVRDKPVILFTTTTADAGAKCRRVLRLYGYKTLLRIKRGVGGSIESDVVEVTTCRPGTLICAVQGVA